MNRALKEQNSDCWINGRRRDHGAERAALPVWEGGKVIVTFILLKFYNQIHILIVFSYRNVNYTILFLTFN